MKFERDDQYKGFWKIHYYAVDQTFWLVQG